MLNLDRHLQNIRVQLSTDAEREFFDASVARMRTHDPLGQLSRIASLTAADAAELLRRELPRATALAVMSAAGDSSTSFTRTPGFRCDSPDSLCDTEGHEVGAKYDDAGTTYDHSTYGE